MHETELKTLRDNLKRARKLVGSSPRDLREEREREVQRLELAVKRAESSVNKDRREKVEQEAMNRAMQQEKAKQKEGKGQFWLKDGTFHLLHRRLMDCCTELCGYPRCEERADAEGTIRGPC